MSNINTIIVVASHKSYWMPEDSLYLPVQVGAAGRATITGFQRDDEGESISEKNPHYCELTALYWAWKNLDCSFVGLAHYRRHFRGTGERGLISRDDLAGLLNKAPVVLPKKRHYFIETVESHYGHTFDPVHIEVVRLALRELSPEYLAFFDAHMKERSSHILNMAIMRKDILTAYCSWLFPILNLVDVGIDYSGMSSFQARAVGRLAERLIDPWLAYNKVGYIEVPIVSMEQVDQVKKGKAFLAAKLLGKHYEESF